MDTSTFIDLERAFWLQGEAFFKDNLDPEAIMVFPDPVGVMHGDAIARSLKDAPRWDDVEIDLIQNRIGENVAVLAYRASALRGNEPPYAALCGSVYERRDDQWVLCFHQQTPAA
ncbi:MAG: nuclear transport factor 2 family protein [Deltaproteobacteria bacterium]